MTTFVEEANVTTLLLMVVTFRAPSTDIVSVEVAATASGLHPVEKSKPALQNAATQS